MSLWVERILGEFPSELAHLWIASDPDDVLLDEQILSALATRGFEILPFEDPITFRTEYEERYRLAWDQNESGTAEALILHLHSADPHSLPWDYLHQARMVHMSLAHLFPRLSYGVVRQIPAATAPIMVHHIPRYLALRRNHGEAKVALLVFDGLAVDQWVQIREQLAKRAPTLAFEEGTCFAWIPTLTAVSRQALFSGLKPREFADSIDTTSREPALWSRFWQDQGLRAGEIFYRKSIRHANQLDELATGLSNPALKVAGIVVDTIDEIVHGAVLGKRGIASQIESWCDSGFVEHMFRLILKNGFHLYLTADHGNVDAVGVGRPQQGVIAETRGERVRVYRSEAFRTQSAQQYPETIRLGIPALPDDFLPLFAAGRTAFSNQGEKLVAHGGISVEELIVPFVKVSDIR